MLRLLLWRTLGLLALIAAVALGVWLLDGGLRAALSGAHTGRGRLSLRSLVGALGAAVAYGWRLLVDPITAPAWSGSPLVLGGLAVSVAMGVRLSARRRRGYERLRVDAYRGDSAGVEAIVSMYETLHKRLLCRWWRRLLSGQPSIALEVHHSDGACWLAVSCPTGTRRAVQAALRVAYPNCRLIREPRSLGAPPTVLRLKKYGEYIGRAKTVDRYEHEREPAMNRLMTTMGACAGAAYVQLALTPVPSLFERHARHLYKRHEARVSRERHEHLQARDRSLIDEHELRGGLEVQHRPLFFADLRIVAADRGRCEQIASQLRAGEAENRLVERATTLRHGLLRCYDRRVGRGEGNPLPSWRRGVFASTELAALWHLPSVDYTTVPFARGALPVAPAPPAIMRPTDGVGTLRDAYGVVSIHPAMRRQNTAVPGTVEQGKSSYLVATVAEDLRRERCAIIVLDPKGDAAEAAVSMVPAERPCTLLDFAHPTCGFNPLAVDAPADVIADYVVAALRHLFTDADIRASSDRYLRNAIIAVLAHDRSSTLWDAARLLSVGEDGYAYRARVGARVRALPELKEISEFFTAELSAQLADARSTTTAKLDAPVNKLARLLNSPSIKRVLLNDSLRVDLDRVISRQEVLVVKGALGAMGAGNTSVLMQLLVGMLDAALARQQDLVPEDRRIAVALKVDEAPLVLNRGFAETIALKRSAGLETVACWQTESQWLEREVRDQLDALFAHRVYFATASTRDARAAVELTMASFSDTVRPGVEHLSELGRPDARLHLPRHHAIASWTTPEGRQPPFVAQTIPMRIDPERLAAHAARQAERGGLYLSDLSQPHWDRERSSAEPAVAPSPASIRPISAERPATQSTPLIVSPVPVASRTPDSRSPASRTPTSRTPASRTPASRSPASRTPASRTTDSRGHASRPTVPAARPAASPQPGKASSTPSPPVIPPDSYRELVELDGAHSVRWAKAPRELRSLEPEALDLEVLTLIAGMGHVLSSQLHRRFNPARAMTTTQRRLKRLSDAGLVARMQFHRRDGGGVPMCYAITVRGLELLHAHERLMGLPVDGDELPGERAAMLAPADARRQLRQARHDVHVTGWALALQRTLGGTQPHPRGARESVQSVPMRQTAQGRVALGPEQLRLPGGRVAHEFLRTEASSGARVAVRSFETVRPDVTIELPAGGASTPGAGDGGSASSISGSSRDAGAVDLLVELDDRLPTGQGACKLERYDHLVAGWSAHLSRYARRLGRSPAVVFVCRDRARARDCARAADGVLGACRAYAGEYPADWEYPGRERIVFAAERDVHEEVLDAYGVPRLPPHVRVSIAHGDPRAGEAQIVSRELLSF
jgi:Replication-relaxation